jgi:hypothetical protein
MVKIEDAKPIEIVMLSKVEVAPESECECSQVRKVHDY